MPRVARYRSWDSRLDDGKGAWAPWVEVQRNESFAEAHWADTQKAKTDPNSGARWLYGKRAGTIVFNGFHHFKFNLVDGGLSLDASRLSPNRYELRVSGKMNTPFGDYVAGWVRDLCTSVKVNDDMVTAALADSKSAELDLLTELGEFPETLGMFKDLLSVFTGRAKDMHKHLQRLRQRSKAEADRERKAYNRYRKKTRRKNISDDDDYEIWSRWKKRYDNARKRAKADYNARKRAAGIVRGPRGATRVVDKMTETWLLYRYGIMPLVYTAQDLMKVLEGKQSQYQTHRQRRIIKDRVVDIGGWNAALAPGLPYIPYKVKCKYTLTERVTLKTCFTGSSLSRKWGVNPAVTAWELTRLSFVVDWFIQVGDFIQALAPSFADQTACVYSRKVEATIWTVLDQDNPFSWVAEPGDILSYKPKVVGISGQVESYHRVVIDPTSHITIPTEVKLNWKRQVDAFALTWPLLKTALTNIKKDQNNGKIQPDQPRSKRRKRG